MVIETVVFNNYEDQTLQLPVAKVDNGHQGGHSGLHFQKKFLKSTWSLLLFFNIAGITFAIPKERRNQKESCWFKFYRVLLVSMAIFQTVPNVTSALMVLKSPKSVSNFINIYNCDNILIIVLFLCYWRNYNGIQTTTDYLMHKMESLQIGAEIFVLVQKCCRVLVGLGLVNCLLTIVSTTIEIYLWPDIFVHFHLGRSFLMDVPQPFLKPVLAFIRLQYYFLTICVYLHFSLISLITYMLCCCFKQLNRRLKCNPSLQLGDLETLLADHQYLAKLCRLASKAFSPTLLILISVKCAQIIFGYNVMLWGIKTNAHASTNVGVWNHVIKTSLTYINAVGFILILTVIGGKLHNEAQKTINTLLDASLRNSEMYQDDVPNKVIKSCHTIKLFTSQRIACPVGISVSGLFVINYSFLALVISTTLTYMTLLPSA